MICVGQSADEYGNAKPTGSTQAPGNRRRSWAADVSLGRRSPASELVVYSNAGTLEMTRPGSTVHRDRKGNGRNAVGYRNWACSPVSLTQAPWRIFGTSRSSPAGDGREARRTGAEGDDVIDRRRDEDEPGSGIADSWDTASRRPSTSLRRNGKSWGWGAPAEWKKSHRPSTDKKL